MSYLVPQRIKVEGHNRYVVEFREEGQGTRAFGFAVTSEPPRTLVEPDAAFLDAMAPVHPLLAAEIMRLVRQFHKSRLHFLTSPAVADE
jgi:hypothetical protein